MKMIKLSTLIVFALGMQNLRAQFWGDYTLYSVQNSSTTQLIDESNAVYHTWTHGNSAKTGYSSYLMPGGILWRTVQNQGNSLNGGGVTGRVQKVDWDGNVLWDFTYSSSTYCLHHDICPLPNGNVLLISYDVKSASEATAAGSSSSSSRWSEKILEVKPTGSTTGEIVWEWKLWDHLVQSTNASAANYQASVLEHPELFNLNYNSAQDWFHMNGIDYNPITDQIAFSSHNMNQWFIIDHSTTTAEAASHAGGNSGKGGDFLYRYGNPASYGATGTTVLNVTHDAHWIPEGSPNAGYLVGFNNRGISNNQSSVDQIALPVDGYNFTHTSGQAFTPATYTLRHACSGGSQNMGNSEQFPNGNMLVCVASSGLMYEIDASGTTIWSKTASGAVPQAHRYESCFIDIEAPAIPVITETSGVLNSTAAATYQWYLNGVQISGATNQSYTPTQSGVYIVRITDANGCVFRYATGYKFTASSTTGLTEQMIMNANLYPNPSTGIINLDVPSLDGKNYEVAVYDLLGKLIFSAQNAAQIDLSGKMNGSYVVTVSAEGMSPVSRKINILK